jgi:hypothetical protein
MLHFPSRYNGPLWSIILLFHAKSAATYGILDGLSQDDRVLYKQLVEANQAIWNHPFHAVIVLLNIYFRENIGQTADIGEAISDLEVQFGVMRWRKAPRDPWEVIYDQVKRLTIEAQRWQNMLPYQERRWDFFLKFVQYLLESYTLYEEAIFENEFHEKADLAWPEIQEMLQNMHRFAQGQQHHVECLFKRTQALLDNVRYLLSVYQYFEG